MIRIKNNLKIIKVKFFYINLLRIDFDIVRQQDYLQKTC